MCCLAIEIIMFVLGVIGVVKGKVSLTRTRVAIGTPARFAGALLLIPLPVYIVANIVAGIAIFGQAAQPANPALEATAGVVSLIAAAVSVACFLVAIIVCAVTAKPLSQRKAQALSIEKQDLDYFDKGVDRKDTGIQPLDADPDKRIHQE
jgi:hypothetical protein